MSIKVEEKKIIVLFRDFWFNIPSYQRPYVWGEDNINELLDDILYAFENDSQDTYFMGALVLQNKENDEYDILDGQQRLTTLALLLATIRDNIKVEKTKKVLQDHLFQEDDETADIPSRNRFTFNIRNEVQRFFEEYIIKENGTFNIEKALEDEQFKNTVSIKNMVAVVLVIR